MYLKPLPKTVLISFGLTAAALVTQAAVENKIFGSCMIILIISKKK